MEKVIHICDKCGVEKIYNKSSESEFRKIKFIVGQKGSTFVSDERYSNGVATKTELFICKDCQLKLGIHNEEKKEVNFNQQPELLDKIFDLFAIIADDLGYVKSE